MHKLHIPVVAMLFALFVAACATSDPELTSQLQEQSHRMERLEKQLSEILASLDEMEASSAEGEHGAMEAAPFELAVAQYVMDTAGFHAIDEALAETGEIDPAYTSAVSRVARVVGSTSWPNDLSESAAHLLGVLTEFQTALTQDDSAAATSLAGVAHDHQHDLSEAISAWLSGEMSEHEHEAEEENAHVGRDAPTRARRSGQHVHRLGH